MRLRTLLVTGLVAMGLLLPAASASADVCYSVDVVLNGEAVVDQSDCIDT